MPFFHTLVTRTWFPWAAVALQTLGALLLVLRLDAHSLRIEIDPDGLLPLQDPFGVSASAAPAASEPAPCDGRP